MNSEVERKGECDIEMECFVDCQGVNPSRLPDRIALTFESMKAARVPAYGGEHHPYHSRRKVATVLLHCLDTMPRRVM
jgi:hypothetical protein